VTFGSHQTAQFTLIHLTESLVRWREHGERAFTAQRVGVASGLHCGEKVRELSCCGGHFQNIASGVGLRRFSNEKAIG